LCKRVTGPAKYAFAHGCGLKSRGCFKERGEEAPAYFGEITRFIMEMSARSHLRSISIAQTTLAAASKSFGAEILVNHQAEGVGTSGVTLVERVAYIYDAFYKQD
jgi:hypothetical protein